MKKILISLAALGTIAAAAAPAAAQDWRDHGRHGGYDRNDGYEQSSRGGRLTTSYVDSLEWKINNAAREGRISWGEARELRSEFKQVQPLAWRVQTGSANRWEYQRLDRTVSRIEQAVDSRGWRGDRDRYAWRR